MMMADHMFAKVSQHKAAERNPSETPAMKDWRLTEDKLSSQAISRSNLNEHASYPPLTDCLKVSLSVDTEKIYGRTPQQRSLMITATEIVMGSQANDTCTADVLCVIDVSGSMAGGKLNNVKTTLKYLVHILGGSRLALIAFDTKSETLMNFKVVNEQNTPKIMDVIESLKDRGSTNITAAVHNAQTLLALRQTRNNVCSVFFLSDGQHNQGPISQEIMFGKDYENAKTEYTLHCFGYGDDHDASLMQGMSERKSGNYYFVHDVKRVDECFVDCLGMVTTALAESGIVRVTFKPSSSGSILKVVETSGTHIKKLTDSSVQAEMLTIYAGLHKDFMLTTEFIPGNGLTGSPEFIEAEIDFEFNKLGAQQLTKTHHVVHIEVVNNGQVPAQQTVSNNTVSKNVHRVKAVEILKAVKTLQAANQNGPASMMVQGYIDELNKDPSAKTDPLLKCLESVMTTTKGMLDGTVKNTYKLENYLVQQINIFQNQASSPLFDQTGLFATAKQQENLTKLKSQ